MNNYKSEALVVNALKNACKFTAEIIRDQCENLINVYGDYLVRLLLEGLDPLKVCQTVTVC